MTLDLTDAESAALLGELDRIIDGDRYPFSPRSFGTGGRSYPLFGSGSAGLGFLK
jgi:hypothetical protein